MFSTFDHLEAEFEEQLRKLYKSISRGVSYRSISRVMNSAVHVNRSPNALMESLLFTNSAWIPDWDMGHFTELMRIGSIRQWHGLQVMTSNDGELLI